ncbi:hypothetical protein PI124_g13915 [Phytophthora idaei]|nr:hypothetical protein PI125_g21860 [Phytophthora idaei]KAG3147087.1 hypothetical protein PI126_g13005 [Phytophthora idaei]KAG3241208.1 hypothetical protein PI124_g13915 [Phytophthora idaei]
MWSSGSSLKKLIRSSQVSRIQTSILPVGVASLQTGFSSSAAERAPRPVRRRGRRKLRRLRTQSECSTSAKTEVISVLAGDGDDNVVRVQELKVRRPPYDAFSITQLPGLSWKHFLRDLKRGEIEQVCIIVPEFADSLVAVEVDAAAAALDTSARPKQAEPKPACEARYAAQSLPSLKASGNPVAPLVREFIEIFPEMVPAVLPPDRGVRHEIDFTSGAKYCVRDSGRFRATRR